MAPVPSVLPAPPVVWGLFARLLGVVYLIAFASLHGQVLGLAGARGISPVALMLARIRTDFPAPQRWFWFPTLLWLRATDGALRAIVVAGMACALGVVAGIGHSGVLLFGCWLLYLSLDVAVDLLCPWDSLLLEAGFLALFLPPLLPLPALAASATAPAAIGWAYRWLFVRLIFGFGKQKFLLSTWADRDYLKGFFVNQPMPTRLALLLHHLPLVVMQGVLLAMFVVEVPLPFLVFAPGWPRLLVALVTALLMVAIQACGNYGLFNVLTVALCVPLLDVHASLFPVPLASAFDVLALAVALVVFVAGLVHLPFNHWCTRTFAHWPLLQRAPRLVRVLLAFCRALAPFRIVHAYGVFPPQSGPPARILPVLEGTEDGRTWHAYRWRSQAQDPGQPPRFDAPFQPRLDFSLCYEGLGHTQTGWLTPLSGSGNPYRFTNAGALERVAERLLEGSASVRALLGGDPFDGRQPIAVRAHLRLLGPTTPGEVWRTGTWWTVEAVGSHFPPVSRRPDLWDTWLPSPVCFHWDEAVWRARAGADRAIASEADVALVFETLLPLAGAPCWETLPQTVARLRSTCDAQTQRRLEEALARLAQDLVQRLRPQVPRVVPTSFHAWFLAHHVIRQGRDAYAETLADPQRAAASCALFRFGTPEEVTPLVASGLWLPALFWYETLRYHACKIRLVHKTWGARALASPLRGVTDIYPFLATVFVDPEEDLMPVLGHTGLGTWTRHPVRSSAPLSKEA